MSQVTIYFGVAPAIAPIIGGWLFVHAGLAQHLLVPDGGRRGCCGSPTASCCPRRCTSTQRQPFNVRNLMRGYWQLGSEPALPAAGAGQRRPVQRHVPLRAVGAGVPGRAPGARRRRSSSGSSCSRSPASWAAPGCQRAAGRARSRRKRQIRHGFVIMLVVSLRQRRRQPRCSTPHAAWALLPIARVRVRLGADGAGGHADGAGPRARAPRHGVVAAGRASAASPTASSPA